MRVTGFVMMLFLLMVSTAQAVGPTPPVQQALGRAEIPAGLSDFFDARGLELKGQYPAALKLYATAVEEAPDVLELRVAEASLMLDLGMSEESLSLLEELEGLDWYGMRVRALALAQVSGKKQELLPRAKAELEEVLKERADDPNVQFSLVRVLEASGELEEALRRLKDLRQRMGGNTRLAGLEGEFLSRMGRSAEAMKAFGECEETVASCREGLIQSLLALGRMAEAGEKLLEGLGPDDLDRMMQAAALLADGNRPQHALEVVDKVLKTDPDSPEARRFKAILLVRLGRMQKAAPLLDELLRKDPGNTDLLLARAGVRAALDLDDIEKARRDLDRAWKVVSEDSGSEEAIDVAVEAARIELEAGHLSVAREWLDRVADPSAGGGNYLFLLAESYRKSGQFQAGVGALLRIEPRLDSSLRPLAVVLEADLGYRGSLTGALDRLRPLLEKGDRKTALMALSELQNLELWARAESESRNLLERFPDDRDILFTRATALERQGRFDDSVALFEELLKAHPEDAGAANYLGYMLADADRDLDHALELIQRAVAAEPENGAYLDSMGWVLYRMDRTAEAEIWLQKALKISGPSSADILAHLGEVWISLGRPAEGTALLQRALDLGCEHPEKIQALISENPLGRDGESK